MRYGKNTFDEQLKENIRGYRSKDLYDLQVVEWQMQGLCDKYGLELMLTDRHGELAVVIGNFEDTTPDVVKNPGKRVRICNHTTGHLYVQTTGDSGLTPDASNAIDMFIRLLEGWGHQSYMARELDEYREELENKLETGRQKNGGEDRTDVLTGALSKTYFENRLKVIDRAKIAPVALIQANINDWKFFHDNYGIEESDRLISTVAKIILDKAKPEYVIGRCEGDLFNIVIPMPEDGEAESYVEDLRQAFDEYEDAVLVPSVAFGIVYKQNVEESLMDKLSDAEFEMFNNKFEMKNAPGYRERIEKGLRA